MQPIINDGPCTFGHEGKAYTANGAYLDDDGGVVYIVYHQDCPSCYWHAETWHGEKIARVTTMSTWKVQCRTYGYYRMRAIRFRVGDRLYHGRFNEDSGQLCRVRRIRGYRPLRIAGIA